MSPRSKRQDFSPSCSQGTWYACSSGSKFVGCCGSDPCANDCPAGNLYPASFDPAYYGKFPDASCSSGLFYTCTSGSTFLGCCKSNPCNQGSVCPKSDLAGAYLGNPNDLSAYGASAAATSSSSARASTSMATLTTSTSTISTSISSSATTTADGSSTSSTTSTPAVTVTAVSNHKAPVAAIAGGAAGGVVAIAVVAGFIIYYILHGKRSRDDHDERIERRMSNGPAVVMAEKPKSGGPPEAGPPPSYSSPNPALPPQGQPPPSAYAFPHDAVYAHQNHDSSQQYELPIALTPRPTVAHRPYVQYRFSELSGESSRFEMESPHASPRL